MAAVLMDAGARWILSISFIDLCPQSYIGNVIIPKGPRAPNCINLCQDGLLGLFCSALKVFGNGHKLYLHHEAASKSPAGI